jgi:hypothetical protein
MVVLCVYTFPISHLYAGGAYLGDFLTHPTQPLVFTRPPTDCVAIDIPGRGFHQADRRQDPQL